MSKTIIKNGRLLRYFNRPHMVEKYGEVERVEIHETFMEGKTWTREAGTVEAPYYEVTVYYKEGGFDGELIVGKSELDALEGEEDE